MIADIQGEILQIHRMGLLDLLLTDKTAEAAAKKAGGPARKHILWATDVYQALGPEYRRSREIAPALITGERSGVIRTRARKALEQQNERTRTRAEVFTPLTIVRRMVSAADAVWFGRQHDRFDEERIPFTKEKTWKRYVDARWLEITCGEAPYLATRYDAATGEGLPLACRTGLLDRKLHAVSENAEGEEEWLRWAFRALEATYGYEFSGDNVLIARVNLFMTFKEYLHARWQRDPTGREAQHAANIIAWNLWQMDGLTGRLPYCREDRYEETSLFAEGSPPEGAAAEEQPDCRIMDWRRGASRTFLHVNEGGRPMKFDFIIGNPPYQEETTTEASKSNGQKPQKNIFHYFQIEADKIATTASVLIYPAGRWIHRSGKGLAKFGLQQINDHKLKKILFYPDSRDIFQGVDIADGISIVIKEMKKKSPGFEYVYCKNGQAVTVHMDNPGEELIPLNPHNLSITQKVKSFVETHHLKYLHDRILPRSLFGIESNFIENHPENAKLWTEGMILEPNEIKLLTNDKAGKSGRAKWFVVDASTIPTNQKYIGEWQVVVSSANAGGQKRDNQLEIIDNHSAFGRSRVALASFKTKEEAHNFFVYIKSSLARFMFLMTDESLTSVGKRVPDLLTYTAENTLIDFSQNVDAQLYKIIGLTKEETNYIEETVNNIRKKEMK